MDSVSIGPLSPPCGGLGCEEGERGGSQVGLGTNTHLPPIPSFKRLDFPSGPRVLARFRGGWGRRSQSGISCKPATKGGGEGRRGCVFSPRGGLPAAGGRLHPADWEVKVRAGHWQKTPSTACCFLFLFCCCYEYASLQCVLPSHQGRSGLYFLPNLIPSSLYLMYHCLCQSFHLHRWHCTLHLLFLLFLPHLICSKF